MLAFCNAKINLGLNIVAKRSDGFHDIETVFYPIGLSDILEIVENPSSGNLEFTSSGLAVPGNINICERAFELIRNDYELPGVKAHLHKHIPIGAGLGGGSSDAAFFIKLINEKFELNISWGEMHHYARQLGSDCSFFITNKPAFAEEKGDQFERIELSLKGYFLVLVCPPIFVSTAEAYSGAKPVKPDSSIEENILKFPIDQWKEVIVNDFEKHIFKAYPRIAEIKTELYKAGAVYASMSGSGSSVYGLFSEKAELKSSFPTDFVWEEML
jgi:4-diphosphocytidyl-2-C-methyl-D-erythritol kinase